MSLLLPTLPFPQPATARRRNPPLRRHVPAAQLPHVLLKSLATPKRTQRLLRATTGSEPEPDETPEPIESEERPKILENAEIIGLKEALKERREKEKDDLVSGVLAEVREIEWPVFGRVLGTTGVVLAVIAGSSLVLLTLNAVLAEVSDRVFVGKGFQDFFG